MQQQNLYPGKQDHAQEFQNRTQVHSGCHVPVDQSLPLWGLYADSPGI